MKHTATLTIPRPQADDAARICAEPPGRSEVGRDEVVYTWTEKFEDGCFVDLKVCATNDPDEDPCYVEAVLFNADGGEMAVCEPCERPHGVWYFLTDEAAYSLEVSVES